MGEQTPGGLKGRQHASPVLPTPGRAQADGTPVPKPAGPSRGEETLDQGGPHVGGHLVFVLASDGTPLTPTTPAKAKRLLMDREENVP